MGLLPLSLSLSLSLFFFFSLFLPRRVRNDGWSSLRRRNDARQPEGEARLALCNRREFISRECIISNGACTVLILTVLFRRETETAIAVIDEYLASLVGDQRRGGGNFDRTR